MKLSNPLTRLHGLLSIAVLAALCVNPRVRAEDAKPVEKLFASPDDAIKALRTAAETKDMPAMHEIFGPEFKQIITGDKVQDADNAQKFAAAMAEACKPVPEGDDKITLEIGTNEWPMSIPLVKAGGQWYFDTAAGREEIINRHIGKDELHAIGVCRAYVTAQKQFAGMNSSGGGIAEYAQKFKSSAEKKDGLYWPPAPGGPDSPFGPLVAEAHAEGYGAKTGSGLRPFHGYYFRILTRQGPAAPGGKMNYLSGGKLCGGFALVAYPEHWDQSGIMTFIVNQDGKVYQRSFGEKTSRLAGSMKEYNPDGEWTLVQDEGVSSAVSEK